MTADIHIDLQQAAELARGFEQAPEIVIDELYRATTKSTLLLERETKENTPVGIGGGGGLKGSVSAREPDVLGDTIIGVVGTPLNYAVPVELGTKPHMPPIQPLADWAEHVLGVGGNEAWRVGRAIAFKIKAKGTEGAHMFERAFTANAEQVQRIFAAAGARIAERLAGGAA